ncbi:phosphatidylserine decarboxylase related protein [Prosthecochloris aestuarii DSM 271]|uniref:Phosphatidylserine decarboxylase proenzyme n=1 Tax=Prosthecochloris aestuarii (strain DSM 271 / SK 413) TaxID=290512 RepID=PSD_PROA2|nr:phosphatidylserine decarboxylase [Prosthecochloris aestuarii]B4S5J9.1 RecName: Full=Phosphatidylserine decarboxylase proenzyme; Contains: RecName: Full=Phosphatidylserine decarboxylase alpha chain; Contains: RecName: Full=Phosphatidylserine decarboxylase beta chain [Prosthecochloris aestuarii DSM 271]ACF45596.1 phosphatidylserine decarboxylase related protein [Prosthecochloris aestuarii DSM 271]
MFARYGRTTLTKTLLLCLAAFFCALLLPTLVQIPVMTLSLLMVLFSLYFFRDPSRTPVGNASAIVAPADGKVLLIRKTDHPFTGKNSTLVSIFMSPFNVHVNRIPINGRVTHLEYHPGKFLMAFDHNSMSDNERMDIGIENTQSKVFFSQVSGFLARRIVCHLTNDQNVRAGEKFGMIKFGSRLDIILPSQAEIALEEGKKTRAGETVVARLPNITT